MTATFTNASAVTDHGKALVKRAKGIEMDIIATCVLDHFVNSDTSAMRKVLKGTAYKVKAPKIADNLMKLKAFNVADILATIPPEAADVTGNVPETPVNKVVAAIVKAIRAYMTSLKVTSTNSLYSKLNALTKGETEGETEGDTDTDTTDTTEADDTGEIPFTPAPKPEPETVDIVAAAKALISAAKDDELRAIFEAAQAEMLAREAATLAANAQNDLAEAA